MFCECVCACVPLVLFLWRVLANTVSIVCFRKCCFLTSGDRGMGKLAAAPAQSIKQCLQPSNWTICFICSKTENKFCLFPLCSYQSVLCYLARAGSFSCGLTGSENNMVIFCLNIIAKKNLSLYAI